MAKAIALLNLVSTTGTIRASSHMLALTDSTSDEQLDDLESAGSSFTEISPTSTESGKEPMSTSVASPIIAHQRARQQPLVEILSAVDDPLPVVAARHSAKHDVLRVFARRYADGGEHIEPMDTFSPYDGEVLLVVSSHQTVPSLPESAAATKPVVAAIPSDLSTLDKVAREVAASPQC